MEVLLLVGVVGVVTVTVAIFVTVSLVKLEAVLLQILGHSLDLELLRLGVVIDRVAKGFSYLSIGVKQEVLEVVSPEV